MTENDAVASGIPVIKHSEIPELQVPDLLEGSSELRLRSFTAQVVTFLCVVSISKDDHLVFVKFAIQQFWTFYSDSFFISHVQFDDGNLIN